MRMARLGKRPSACHSVHIDDQQGDSTALWNQAACKVSSAACHFHKSCFLPNPHPRGEGREELGGEQVSSCFQLFHLAGCTPPEPCKLAFFMTTITSALYRPPNTGTDTELPAVHTSPLSGSRSLLRLRLIISGLLICPFTCKGALPVCPGPWTENPPRRPS